MIAGAGGFGRGVYSWACTSPRFLEENRIGEIVFINDGKPERPVEAPLISSIESYEPESGDLMLCAVAAPKVRKQIVRQLERKDTVFTTFVDDRAIVAPGTQVGVGSIILPGVVLGASAKLGEHVHVNFNSSIGHDSILGEFTTLSPSTNIMGEVVSGQRVFYGGSAVVLPRLSVGTDAVVGAGAVVTKDVAACATVVGVPARAKILEIP